MAIAVMRALRPAVPAVIGAAALTFLFAAVMPLAWVTGISWNLYLDRLSPLFEPPVGNGGRLALALGMAAVAALIAGLVALALARPDAVSPRLRRGARAEAEAGLDNVLPRRRADFHPDDPPRPPLRAGRDLPAGGLAPFGAAREAEQLPEAPVADLAPAEPAEGDEPWLQPAELAMPRRADSLDRSLGAMVARLEAGLARRQRVEEPPQPPVPDESVAATERPGGAVDFALEAALGTLQRMNRQVAG